MENEPGKNVEKGTCTDCGGRELQPTTHPKTAAVLGEHCRHQLLGLPKAHARAIIEFNLHTDAVYIAQRRLAQTPGGFWNCMEDERQQGQQLVPTHLT
eukprot:1152292-Pelagomonas_calceolata.AAC.9